MRHLNFISRRYLDLVLCREKYKKIVPDVIIKKFRTYINEALEIWSAAIDTFHLIEKQTETPYQLKIKPQLFAVDGIAFADSLGISKEKRFIPLQAFSIYYLSVHLIDDLTEDPIKFCSKFSPKNDRDRTSNDEGRKLRTSVISFILHASMTNLKLFSLNFDKNKSTTDSTEIFWGKFINSLAIQIKYFSLEKSKNLLPKEVLKIKQRHVSGEATSFIADCLRLNNIYNENQFKHIKMALTYLGSLTQFTDDLRDYEEDKRKGNANLLISMEKFFGRETKKTFIAWYLKEEQFMLNEFKRAGLRENWDFICAVPWFPFFMKTFITKLLLK